MDITLLGESVDSAHIRGAGAGGRRFGRAVRYGPEGPGVRHRNWFGICHKSRPDVFSVSPNFVGTTQTSVTLYTRTSVTLFTFMKRLEVGVKEWLAIFCCVDGRA